MKVDESYPNDLSKFVGAFFDELIRGGIEDVVISPGSRSTPLSVMAYRSSLNVYVDVDERGAAFFALGLAKSTGRAVAVICTSGTAVANYYPAVLEAEISRVPLLVLSGDRPARLQQLGAPQTCDQLKIFGSHVRKFWNMPEPDGSSSSIRYARQIAREAIAALSPRTLISAPVHINFPFDEPLLPALDDANAFIYERSGGHSELPLIVESSQMLDRGILEKLEESLVSNRVIAVCGEGTLGVFEADRPDCWERQQRRAELLCAWAHCFDIPLMADPLSQLRNFNDDAIIDNYDNIFGREDLPDFDIVIRFGRYPVSKRLFKTLELRSHVQIVIDPLETRDFDVSTTTLIKIDPVDFIESFSHKFDHDQEISFDKTKYDSQIARWKNLNDRERSLIDSVTEASSVQVCTAEGCHSEEIALEGAYVQTMLEIIPDKALLFSANSMAIRALDTFYVKHQDLIKDVVLLNGQVDDHRAKRLSVLANRGLNGIDGTLSSALGAAQAYDQTYFLTGDLTLMHDLNALALQHEFALRAKAGAKMPSVIVILFNNCGGGIFEMLPQRSEDPYFGRLFETPQVIHFGSAAEAFGVLYKQARTLSEFRDTLKAWNGAQGVHLVEVRFSLENLPNRYHLFQ